MSEAAVIISPIEQTFTCHSCGLCCTTPWKVKVDPEKAAGIRATQRFSNAEKRGYTPLPVIEGEMQVGRGSDGACVFHVNSGCSVHREEGKSAKPSICQLYPYSIVNTPEGFYLSLRFSCPSVLKNDGEPISDQLDSVSRVVTESSLFMAPPMPADSHVALTHQKAVSWTQYLELEEPLARFVCSEHPVRDTLKAAILLCSQASNLSEIDWDDPALSAEQFGSGAEFFPFYCAYTIAYLETQNAPDKRDSFCEALLNGESPSSNLLYDTKLPELEFLKPPSVRTQALVARYLRNFIQGKQLLSGAPAVARLLMLSVSVAVLLFYLKAKADGVEDPTEDDLAWSFHLVDTCVAGHSDTLTSLYEHYAIELEESLGH